MNRHKILFFAIVLVFVFFFGFLATYSHNKMAEQAVNIGGETIPAVPVVDTTTPVVQTPSPTDSSEFGSLVALNLHSTATFTDGLTVTLKEINDSRCPSGVQCVWAGELATVLELSHGTIPVTQEVRLGSVTSKNITVGGYTLTLNTATTDSIRFVVSKN